MSPQIAGVSRLFAVLAILAGSASLAQAQEDLAKQGYAVLKKYCYRCHGANFEVPGMNVLDGDTLTPSRGPDKKPYLTLGKPDDSFLWQRMGVDHDMPPPEAPDQPTAAERALIRRWIEAGAVYPGREKRPFRSEREVLLAIRDHLASSSEANREFQRYYTLTNLYNNHEHVSADELRLYRAALSKLVNSLSWQNSIVLPQPIDAEATIFMIDLRDLGWDKNDLWREILKVYPYGLKHDRSPDSRMADLAREVARLAGADLPYVRADWFISSASRPPLYHTMLELPTEVSELEKKLNVDVQSDFLRNRLARAGFATSGVSRQNRLVDRHNATHGSYWKSYDFKANKPVDQKADLFLFPLGPKFDKHPFPEQAFDHDGGEMIFHLPNGLMGYFLTDEKGKRIDIGPVDVVNDPLKTSGTPEIVTGLSCMACHKHGVVRFKDTIVSGTGVAGDVRRKLQELFPPQETMNKLLDQDEARFLAAMQQATGQFLQVGDDKNKEIREFPEPIAAIARQYNKDLGPAEAAYELGIAGPAELARLIQANPQLREMGLGPLAQGNTINRDTWQSLKQFLSQFQRAANQLELGTPHRVF